MAKLDDAFDGYNTLQIGYTGTGTQSNYAYDKNGASTVLETNNRQYDFPVEIFGDLQVSRKVFVPENDTFSRWLNIVTNTGAASEVVTLSIANNLGSDNNTVIVSSSSGDNVADLSDLWVTTFQNYVAPAKTSTDPRLGHVLQGVNPPVGLSQIVFADGSDKPAWGYQFTLAPGQTGIVMNFVTCQGTKAAAAAQADALAHLQGHALDFLSSIEKAELLNFAPPTVPNVVGMSQLTAGNTLIGANYVVGTVTEAYSYTVAAGNVISQTPSAGEDLPFGSAVALVVSKGPEPITGSMVINSNAPTTNSTQVTLTLTWSSGVTRMRFSDDGAHWSLWEPVSATRPYTLPAGDGNKTVRVQYLDRGANRSNPFSDYIRLAATPPTGTIVINSGAAVTTSASVMLGLTWADLTGGGVTSMRFSDNGYAWSAWEPVAATRPYTLPGPNGYHTVRVQYLDRAGNYSAAVNDYIRLAMP